MRLTSLKISGFKSFAEAQSIPFRDGIVAIVGPNGCGKSNTLDAIRWVLGESAARQLRADDSNDVLFNGSARRKPVAMASVELVFDNSSRTLQGPMNALDSISVQRQHQRDSTSRYRLNGKTVRRRDVVDLFMGTGLSPRSYALIEQGMISRILEARPQDMRLFLEEIAGVGQYRSRRQETRSHMEHTRSNLQQLELLCLQLDQELVALSQQAQQARAYQQLLDQTRQWQRQLWQLQWQACQQQSRQEQQRYQQLLAQIAQAEQALTELQRAQTEAETQQESLQLRQQSLQQLAHDSALALKEAQAAWQAHDQQQAQLLQERERLALEVDQLHIRRQQVVVQLDESRQSVDVLTQQQASAADDVPAHEARVRQARGEEHQYSEQMRQLRQQASSLHQQLATLTQLQRQLEQQQTRQRQRLDSLHQQQQQLDRREQALRQEQQALTETVLPDLEGLQADEQALQQQLDAAAQALSASRVQLHQCQQQLAAFRGEHKALLQVQQQHLPSVRHEVPDVLQQATPVLQMVEVAPEWRPAVEGLCHRALTGWQLTGFPPTEQLLQALQAGRAGSVAFCGWGQHKQTLTTEDGQQVICWPMGLAALFPGLRLLPSLADALSVVSGLQASGGDEASLYLCRDGWLVSAHGCEYLLASDLAQQGMLDRLQRCTELDELIAGHQQQVEQLQAQTQEAQRQVDQLQPSLRHQQQALLQARQTLQAHQHALDKHQHADEQLRQQQASFAQQQQVLAEDLAALETQLDDNRQQRAGVQQQQQRLQAQIQACQPLLDAATLAHSQALKALTQAQQARAALDKAHGAAVQQHQLLLQQQGHLQESQAQLTQRQQHWQQRWEAHQQQPLTDLEPLQAQVEQHRQSLTSLSDSLQQARAQKQALAQALTQQRQVLAQLQEQRAASQSQLATWSQRESQLRSQQQDEGWQELDSAPVPAAMPDGKQLEKQLRQAMSQLRSFGGVNMIAADLYQEKAEQRALLAQQITDLNDSLAHLNSAITTMDDESRERLTEAFTQAASHFETFFARMFNGGEARLSWEGASSDILDDGLLIMARPPGKRISSIHLLSGGEKTLTAIAFIFSLFRMRPSPFCFLDEIDAPLDDANVGRLCALLQELSDQVQFILITHNKKTMTIADQLVGVTMNEPGVSRIVSVDVAQALQWADKGEAE